MTTVYGADEIWLSIPEYEGWYEASSHGNIRSVDRWDGMNRWKTGQPLRANKCSPAGHLGVTLWREGVAHKETLHALVLMTFVGPRPEGQYGCHRDDVKTHNTIWNLYWGTPKENAADLLRNFGHHHLKKTHCPRGHEYNEENTYRYKTGRYCRECNRQYHRNGGVWPK